MGDILIRGVSKKTVAHWKRRAKANGRSLQAELRRMLEREVPNQPGRTNFVEAARRLSRGPARRSKARPSPDAQIEDTGLSRPRREELIAAARRIRAAMKPMSEKAFGLIWRQLKRSQDDRPA